MALKNSHGRRRQHQPACRARRHGSGAARAAASSSWSARCATTCPTEAGAEWIGIIPGTDTALMLALVHTLVTEGLHDRPSSTATPRAGRCSSAICSARADGQPKDAAWAAPITGVAADTIRALARRLARQARADHRRRIRCSAPSMASSRSGWALVLAAALGQIGLPGGGYGYALGAIGYYGRRVNAVPLPTLPQGRNGVARLHPGRAHRRHAAEPRRAAIATTARPAPIRTSAWSTGPAAIPSTTTRTSTACARPSPASTRWSCMSSPGPRRPGTPISCCPAP